MRALLLAAFAFLPLACPALAAPRIAALSPAVAVILKDLGLEDRIVARHAYDMVLDKDLPIVGDQLGIDYEALLLADPTHILLQWGARDLPPRLLSIADSKDWSVASIQILSLDDIRDAVTQLDQLVGNENTHELADALRERMAEAWTPREGLRERAGKCLPLYATSPPAAAGPGSFNAQLLEALGVQPAIEAGEPYIRLDLEDLRALDPDSIVLFAPGASADRLDELLDPLRRAHLRAVENDRVILINHPLAQLPSTAMIDIANTLAAEIQRLPEPGERPVE